MSERSLVLAVKAMLSAGLTGGWAGVKVYHSKVTDATPPAQYVVLTGGVWRRDSENFGADYDSFNASVRLTIVASLATSDPGVNAELLANKVISVLVGKTPDVTGYRCAALRMPFDPHHSTDEQLVSEQAAFVVVDLEVLGTPAL